MHPSILIALCLALSISTLFGWTSPGWAESTAQSTHWGALAFPDHDRTLTLGFTTDRFTEFDGAGNRYNDIRQTDGFNFWSLSWTERLERFKGWNTNLTVGAGPTGDRFSRYLQNDVVHKFRGLTPVPVGATRDATDFMISGTLTKWTGLLGSDDVFFYGIGGAAGSLYYEPYAQIGLRRLSLLEFVPVVSNYIRFSALGRYGRPFSGAAFHQVAPHSYLGQASIGIGNYRRKDCDIPWELEVGLTVDSGLFVDHRGDSLEERFVTLALHVSAVTFETWNDLINQKDYGPTFGARMTLDLLYLYDRLTTP
ncbi:MAG: hypothetical protein RL042_1031 [Nitrospirota bacterium]|jgi:hypothetical protein